MNKKGLLPLVGGVVAAIAASSCCILPLLLGAASAGSVGLGASLSPYRPYFITLTVLMLGGAFYSTYRPEKAGCETACCSPGNAKRSQRVQRAFLWVMTLFTAGTLAYPTIAAYRAQASSSSVPSVTTAMNTQTDLFTIPAMDCPSCAVHITNTLQKTPGVYVATVDYDTKLATVRYDPTRLDRVKLRAAIDQTGFLVTKITSQGNK